MAELTFNPVARRFWVRSCSLAVCCKDSRLLRIDDVKLIPLNFHTQKDLVYNWQYIILFNHFKVISDGLPQKEKIPAVLAGIGAL